MKRRKEMRGVLERALLICSAMNARTHVRHRLTARPCIESGCCAWAVPVRHGSIHELNEIQSHQRPLQNRKNHTSPVNWHITLVWAPMPCQLIPLRPWSFPYEVRIDFDSLARASIVTWYWCHTILFNCKDHHPRCRGIACDMLACCSVDLFPARGPPQLVADCGFFFGELD
jgi:hypothetical protein